MICPRCKSENVSITVNKYMKSKRRSLLWNVLMTCITGGLWLIWMLVRKRKEKEVTVKTCICQVCGKTWKA